jgi:pyridoxal biosynthesis lyase PdxS
MYPAEENTPSRAFSLFLFTYPSGSFLASPPAAAASAIVPGARRYDEPTWVRSLSPEKIAESRVGWRLES